MSHLDDINFNWDLSCRDEEYKKWKDNRELSFSGNQNKSEESKPFSYYLAWDKGKQYLKRDTWDKNDRKDTKEINKVKKI